MRAFRDRAQLPIGAQRQENPAATPLHFASKRRAMPSGRKSKIGKAGTGRRRSEEDKSRGQTRACDPPTEENGAGVHTSCPNTSS